MAFKIGDKVRIIRSGRIGVIAMVKDGIAYIRPNDDISSMTAEFVGKLVRL